MSRSEFGATLGRHSARLAIMASASAAVLLTGCANFSPDGGMAFVQGEAGGELNKDIVKIRTEHEAAATKMRVYGLLKKPLVVESAVQIALLNNRGLQAAYSELGISEAQMVEASLPPSPTISLARIVATGELEIERQILQNVLGLLTLPRRKEIAEAKFQQAGINLRHQRVRVLRNGLDADAFHVAQRGVQRIKGGEVRHSH